MNEVTEVLKSVDREQMGIPTLFEIFDVMMARSAVRKRVMENSAKFYPELYERVMTENRDFGLSALRDQLNTLVEKGLISEMADIDLSVTMFYYTSMGLMRRQGRLVLPNGISELDAFRYTIINFFLGLKSKWVFVRTATISNHSAFCNNAAL